MAFGYLLDHVCGVTVSLCDIHGTLGINFHLISSKPVDELISSNKYRTEQWMRRGCHDNGFITHNDEIIGVCLGYDFAAEHEWGIRGLKRHFDLKDEYRTWYGVIKPCLGIEKRRVRQVNEDFIYWRDEGDVAHLVFAPMTHLVYGRDPKRLDQHLNSVIESELRLLNGETLATAWDERSFGIRVKGREQIETLRSIYDALLDKDIALMFKSGDTPFSNNGLCLVQISKFPEEHAKQMETADQDRLNMLKAAEETGIEQLLKASGKRWFALSPRWASNMRNEVKSEYPVVFWLNPMEQDRNNFGWYTVEDLKLWAQNRGPIPKR